MGHVDGGDLPPDTYVADWDAVGTQAFTAAALTPAEGHTIFAYVAIAVYDSVMAIEGGYEPFAVDTRRTGGRIGRGGRRRRRARHPACTTSRRSRRDRRSGVHRVAADHRRRPGRGRRRGDGRGGGGPAHRAARRRRLPRPTVTYTPPNPPIPGVWIPTGPAADRAVPRPDGAVQPALRRPVPAGRSPRPAQQEVGAGLQRGQGDRLAARARRGPPSRRWRRGSGAKRRCSRHAARSASSSATTSSTSWRPRGSWR